MTGALPAQAVLLPPGETREKSRLRQMERGWRGGEEGEGEVGGLTEPLDYPAPQPVLRCMSGIS